MPFVERLRDQASFRTGRRVLVRAVGEIPDRSPPVATGRSFRKQSQALDSNA